MLIRRQTKRLQRCISYKIEKTLFGKEPIQITSGKHQTSIVQFRHPWIFSNAVKKIHKEDRGTIRNVIDAEGRFIGQAFFNGNSNIYGRFLYRNDKPLDVHFVLREKIRNAIQHRNILFPRDQFNKTNCYRLVNSDGDGLSGLIVDRYNDVLVLQIHTMGIEKLKPIIIEELKSQIKDVSLIIEKSGGSSRRIEGLPDDLTNQVHYGEWKDEVIVAENEMKFIVSFKESQKTGFFLDQREMRKWCMNHSKNFNVLNCFSYTGGFSIASFFGNAKKVDSVEISEKAMNIYYKNLKLNNFDHLDHNEYTLDVFTFLEKENLQNYNLIILDPPAFVKSQQSLKRGMKGYYFLHKKVFENVKSGTFILTSSCSYYMNEDLFRNIIFQAAAQNERNVKIIGKHLWAPDHPVNVFCKETEYLKSFILYVE